MKPVVKTIALVPMLVLVAIHTDVPGLAHPQSKASPSNKQDTRRYIDLTKDAPSASTAVTITGEAGDKRAETFSVTGTLVRKNGAPVPGKAVYAFPLEAGGACCVASLETVKGKLVLRNPSGRSGPNGRFSIKMTYSTEYEEFVVGFYREFTVRGLDVIPHKYLPVIQDGALLKIRVGETTKVVDLGRIVVQP